MAILKEGSKLTNGETIETTKGSQDKVNTHANSTSNPHNVTKSQVGLSNVDNYSTASQSEAESGSSNSRFMTPLRTRQSTEHHLNSISSVGIGVNVDPGTQNSVAIGVNARTSNGPPGRESGVAIGHNSRSSYGSVAIGTDALVSSAGSVSVGRDAVGFNYSTAIGEGAHSDMNSVSIGAQSKAEGVTSVAIGRGVSSLNDREGVLGGSESNRTVNWTIPGSLSVSGTKNFEMPHPHPDKRETHKLRHGAVESPTAGDNLYRYNIVATKNNETVELVLPDYFEYLNKDIDVWVNGTNHFGRAYGEVKNGVLKVTCELAGEYKCLVIGTRKDDHDTVRNWDVMGVERPVGLSWNGETYAFEVDEIIEIDEIMEV